jgi:hypothetical protein
VQLPFSNLLLIFDAMAKATPKETHNQSLINFHFDGKNYLPWKLEHILGKTNIVTTKVQPAKTAK